MQTTFPPRTQSRCLACSAVARSTVTWVADRRASLPCFRPPRILLIRRARLMNNAENKLQTLSDLVDEQNHVEHTLFYCTPEQIDAVVHLQKSGCESSGLSIII